MTDLVKISTADLEKELERRRVAALKAEYEQLEAVTDYVSQHYDVFSGLAKLLGGRPLPRQDDLCGAGHQFLFGCSEVDLDQYYCGNSGKLVWEK